MEKLTKEHLIQYFQNACKPPQKWRIGTEHEKLLYRKDSLQRVSYDNGIELILQEFISLGWDPLLEKGRTIALSKGEAAITLEPGGQFELSGAPFETVHQTAEEIKQHFKDLEPFLEKLGFFMALMGYDPKWNREERPWMPKRRYDIMRPYMLTKGQLGHDMMTGTCTVQVNLDFSSEQDMVKKFRVSLALQPVAIALFANSPFSEGKPNGFQSYRSWIWQDTDPDRCGLLPFVFAENMGFERYVDYALKVPMYFVYREGAYINVTGQSFEDFMEGRLPGFPGEFPTLTDWENHLTTLFPEVRLKKFLELRGADAGPLSHLQALPAFWTGLLYDDQTLENLNQRIQDWSFKDIQDLYLRVAREGLKASFQGQPLYELAQDLVLLSRQGLQRRARRNSLGQDESVYLVYLEELLEGGESLAEKHLRLFKTLAQENIDLCLLENFHTL